MKKLLPAASFLLLSALVATGLRASAPAQAAQPAQGQALEARVSTLETDLAAERRRHDETRALLEQAVGYLDKQSKAAQALLTVLDESESQGFAVGENWRSRETLLAGLRAFWGGAQSGLPKLPEAPAASKPTTPQRPARK